MGAEGGRLALNSGSDLVEIDHVVQIQIQYEIAVLPRVAYHEAYLGKFRDGFRDRRSGDAQRRGNLIDIQFCPRTDAQLNDLIIKKLSHKIPQLRVGVCVDVFFELVLIHSR